MHTCAIDNRPEVECPKPEGSCVGCKHWREVPEVRQIFAGNCRVCGTLWYSGGICSECSKPEITYELLRSIIEKPGAGWTTLEHDMAFEILELRRRGAASNSKKQIEPIQQLTLKATPEMIFDKIEQIIDALNDLRDKSRESGII